MSNRFVTPAEEATEKTSEDEGLYARVEADYGNDPAGSEVGGQAGLGVGDVVVSGEVDVIEGEARPGGRTQIGSGMRLRQVHSPGPDTRIHIREVLFFQFLAAMCIQCKTGAGSQHRSQSKRHIGALHHFGRGAQSRRGWQPLKIR